MGMMVNRHRPIWSLAIGIVLIATQPGRADDAKIVAVIDQAKLVKIPAGTQTLVIGNPTVADVTLIKQNNLMILSPKAFGETNFIALDAQGNPVAESMIEVIGSSASLIVQRGAERQSFSCTPLCQPTERLGDDDKYLSAVASQDQAHVARLTGSATPAPTTTTAAR